MAILFVIYLEIQSHCGPFVDYFHRSITNSLACYHGSHRMFTQVHTLTLKHTEDSRLRITQFTPQRVITQFIYSLCCIAGDEALCDEGIQKGLCNQACHSSPFFRQWYCSRSFEQKIAKRQSF